MSRDRLGTRAQEIINKWRGWGNDNWCHPDAKIEIAFSAKNGWRGWIITCADCKAVLDAVDAAPDEQ